MNSAAAESAVIVVRENLADVLGDRLRVDEELAGYTTWGVGGPARLLLAVETQAELEKTLDQCRRAGCPAFILGGGSNLLVSDQGFPGAVIRLSGTLTGVSVEGARLSAGAGARLAEAVRAAAGAGLSGLEWAAGIPGTVGGAIMGNAGAFGSCIGDLVVEVSACSPDGSDALVSGADLSFGYRSCGLPRGWVIAQVVLGLRPDTTSRISARMDEYAGRRKSRHPSGRSAGSVFKNPPGQPAGSLIEKSGCKGMRRGRAFVSDKHANFIVAENGATAADVAGLIMDVRSQVYSRLGTLLELEVQLVGDFPEIESSLG